MMALVIAVVAVGALAFFLWGLCAMSADCERRAEQWHNHHDGSNHS